LNVLICWLGNADIDNYEKNEQASLSTIMLQGKDTFDEVHVLDNQFIEKWKYYKEWLCNLMEAEKKDIPIFEYYDCKGINVINFHDIYKSISPVIKKLHDKYYNITINFTGGTPAMSAISAILGYGVYDVKIIQTSRGDKENGTPGGFINAFDEMINSFLDEGFNSEKSILPIGTDNNIIDG